MDFGGRTERNGIRPSRDRRASHPLSIGARMMVRERVDFPYCEEVNLGGIAEVLALLSHGWDESVFFVTVQPSARFLAA